ncbi:MAG TPA: hypothetical protein VMU51_08565 [Mycobacteriales bacterium]|nr:hypothetical protein [Mycobacteriales bacterium]
MTTTEGREAQQVDENFWERYREMMRAAAAELEPDDFDGLSGEEYIERLRSGHHCDCHGSGRARSE